MYLLAHMPTSLPSGEPSALPTSDPSNRPTQMPSDRRVWNEVQKVIASDGAVSDEFGNVIYVSGGVMVVGARFNDGEGTNAGCFINILHTT